MKLLCALHELGLLDPGTLDIDPTGLLIAAGIAIASVVVVAVFLLADEVAQAPATSTRSTQDGTRRLAGPWMVSSNSEWLSEGSRFSSIDGVPLERATETKPAAG